MTNLLARARGRRIAGSLATCLALSASGCLYAGIAVAVKDATSSSPGAAPAPNTAPTVTIEAASIPASVVGTLVLAFRVADAQSDAVSIEAEISIDGGATFRAIPAAAIVAGSAQGLAASPGGTRFSFAINLADPGLFPGRTVAAAVIRLRARDARGLEGAAVESAPFRIENNSPPVVSLETNLDAAGQVLVTFDVSDPDATRGPGVTGLVLTDAAVGPTAVATFAPITASLPIAPGTLLIRYGNGEVLKDVDQGDGTGALVSLNGPDPVGDARIDYATGTFSGDATITVTDPDVKQITADHGHPYLTVTAVGYLNLRAAGSAIAPCTSFLREQSVPFPVFVSPTPTAQTFVWDSPHDLGLGNSKFVSLSVTVTDGQDSATASGAQFFIDNGPLGDFSLLPVGADAEEMAVGDIDHDGLQDIVVVSSPNPDAAVSVYFGSAFSLEPVVTQALPVPQMGGVNLIDSPPSGFRPAGGLEPRRLALLDVNQDGLLDLVVGSLPRFPEGAAPEYFANVFIYFGTGDRLAPFDVDHPWGPLPAGGFGVNSVRAFSLNDDNGDGVVDARDTTDLAIITRFGHDPTETRTRAPVVKAIPVTGEPLPDEGSVAGYALAGVTLAHAPVIPGSLSISFNGGAATATDAPTFVSGLGVVSTVPGAGSAVAIAYIRYADGAFLSDPRAASLPAPLGPLPGATTFAVSGAPSAGYSRSAPIAGADAIDAAAFITTPLVAGDTITVRGSGTRGFTNLLADADGQPILGADGLPAVAVDKTDGLLPIQASLVVGTDVSTFGDLCARLATLYGAELTHPEREVLSVSVEVDGTIALTVEKAQAGSDTPFSPAPVIATAADIHLSDSRGNAWPIFQDPHGRVTVYHVRPVANEGGFYAPDLARDFEVSPGVPLFPQSFPATRLSLLPESPDPTTGRAGAAGPGTVPTVAALAQAASGALAFPFSTSTAAGDAVLIADPLDPPEHLGADSRGAGTYTSGFTAFDAEAGTFLPFDASAGPTDALPDLVVNCLGDGSLVTLIGAPRSAVLAQAPAGGSIARELALYDYLDGLYATQAFDAAGAINTTVLRALGMPAAQGFFLVPSPTDTLFAPAPKLRDVDGDGLLDLVGPLGNLIVEGRNLSAAPPAGTRGTPLALELCSGGLVPGRIDLGDVNGDGLVDIVAPITPTNEVVTLIQVPRGVDILLGDGAVGVSITAHALANIDRRAVLFAPTFRIDLRSNAVPMAVLPSGGAIDSTGTLYRLELVANPDTATARVVAADVGRLDAAAGTVSLSLDARFPVDADARRQSLVARYDQLFQTDYLLNLNLLNFDLVRFSAGLQPFIASVFDLNHDKLDDVITLDVVDHSVGFQLQARESPYSRFVSVPTGISPLLMCTGDVIQGNGKQEVIVSNTGSNSISIYVVDPVAGLTLVQEVPLSLGPGLPVPVIPIRPLAVNLNGDGGPDDIVVVCGAIAGADQIHVDGFPDEFSGGFVIIPGLTQAEFAAGKRFQATQLGLGFEFPATIRAVDVNADGKPDLVLTNLDSTKGTASGLTFYLNRGPGADGHASFANVPGLPISVPIDGPFAAPTRRYFTSLPAPVELFVTDLDGDGFPDIVTALGTGVATGFPAVAIFPGKDPRDTSDPLSAGEPFHVAPGGPVPGGFLPAFIDVSAISGGAAFSLAIGDFNMDGKPDIVITDFSSRPTVGILFNNSTPGGLFDTTTWVPVPLPAVGLPDHVSVGDVNGDGLPDLVIMDFAGSNVLIYLNQYDASKPELFDPANPQNQLDQLFAPPIVISAGREVFDALIMDVNGDGLNDLLVNSNGSNAINVFFHR